MAGRPTGEVLTLAVPEGRLFGGAITMLRHLGMLDGSPQERSLVLSGPAGGRILIARPVDLVTYVEHGAADAAVVGKDVLLERGGDVYELLDLRFGACRGVVALPGDDAERLWAPGRLLRIATKYPRTAARFFEQAGRPVEIIELRGAVELAPRVGLADGILDLVMTGRTLRENLLVEVAEVFRSTARLVVNRMSLRMKADLVRDLMAGLERVLEGPVPETQVLEPTPDGEVPEAVRSGARPATAGT